MKFRFFILTLLINTLFIFNTFAQQWVMDEIAEEARENGSDYTPIPGLVCLGLIIFVVHLWDQHKKAKEEAQYIQEQKKQKVEFKEKSAIVNKEKQIIIEQAKSQEICAVDLGLSVLWADRNLFASSCFDKGEMFAWGDNTPKEKHTYAGAYLNGKSGNDLANIIGNKKKDICGNISYDPVANIMGDYWRLPQAYEMEELIRLCDWTWEIIDNVYGYKVTGKNGNSIFLPVTGTHVVNEQKELNKGFYWTGSGSAISFEAKCLCFMYKWHVLEDNVERWKGCAVRPVWAKPEPTIDTIIEEINNKINKWQVLTAQQKYETYKLSFMITITPPSNDGVEDLYRHACYSEDGKRLVSMLTGAGTDGKCPELTPKYGTEIICDRAYDDRCNNTLGRDKLIIPNTVFAIGNFAFEYLNCNVIKLPSSLKFLTGNPVKNKFTYIESDSPYFQIKNNALLSTDNIYYISNLDNEKTKVVVPDKIEIIGRNAFYSNNKLEHIIFPKSVLALSDYFIQGCDKLNVIEFLGAVQVVDQYSFSGCKLIKLIIVPDDYVVYYQNLLPQEFHSRIRPKSSATHVELLVEQIAVEDDNNKRERFSAAVIDCRPSSDDLALIKKYKDKCKKTFVDKKDWDETIIDWGIHENEEHECWDRGDAQYSNDGARLLRHTVENETYTIKNGTKTICDYAFGDSSRIENIIIPKSVTCLGDIIFWRSRGLEKFTIPQSIRTITGNPFCNCYIDLSCDSPYFCIENEVLYNKEKNILISIYCGNKYRKKIDIYSNIKIIGRSAFYEMYLDCDVFVIPDSVIYIADRAFYHTIFNIKLPSNLIEIGESAFEHCYLKVINIPDSVQKIGKKAFHDCEQLVEVKLPSNLKTIEKETFSSCEKLVKIHIPEGCKIIREEAFWSCYNLVDVYLPTSLELIEKDAFGNGHLTSVVVSKKTKIEDEAFPENCKIIFRD